MDMAQQTTEMVQAAAFTTVKRGDSRWRGYVSTFLPPTIVILLVLAAWQAFVVIKQVPDIVLPPPSAIFQELLKRPGYFFVENGGLTLFEALAGFMLGAAAAVVLAAIMARSRFMERTFFPLALIIKATPIVVVAPLLVIWFGYGFAGKIIMAALICFFPILVNTIVGLRSVNPTALEFLESVSASEWEIFTRLRVPTALPYVLAGFKISISLAVIGAVVAEWAGASSGLGRVIIIASNNFNQPAVFASVLVLAVMGIVLTAIISWLEHHFLYWHESVIVG
jgi:NitT/TauT family transport system permease protein